MENFRDWIEEEAEVVEAKTRYKSKHDPRPTLVKSGFNPVVVCDPCDVPKRVKTKPAVPSRKEGGNILAPGNKNFVLANAVQAILAGYDSKPSVTAPAVYMRHKSFGKVPTYLKRVQKDIVQEKEDIAHFFQQQQRQEEEEHGREYELDEDERLQLLDQLKEKWDGFNEKYQRQAHLVDLDTAGKVERKKYLETMLKKVETAIESLEKGPVTIFTKPQVPV